MRLRGRMADQGIRKGSQGQPRDSPKDSQTIFKIFTCSGVEFFKSICSHVSNNRSLRYPMYQQVCGFQSYEERWAWARSAESLELSTSVPTRSQIQLPPCNLRSCSHPTSPRLPPVPVRQRDFESNVLRGTLQITGCEGVPGQSSPGPPLIASLTRSISVCPCLSACLSVHPSPSVPPPSYPSLLSSFSGFPLLPCCLPRGRDAPINACVLCIPLRGSLDVRHSKMWHTMRTRNSIVRHVQACEIIRKRRRTCKRHDVIANRSRLQRAHASPAHRAQSGRFARAPTCRSGAQFCP